MTPKSKSRTSLLSRSRPFVQGFFLLVFLYLFVRIAYPLSERLANNFFFNLDPLIPLAVAIAGTVVIAGLLWSLVTVVVTVLFGRVFCGWMCPLGTIFDWSAKLIPSRVAKKPWGNGRWHTVKYYLLVFLLIGSIAGFSALLFFDPLVFLFRSFTFLVYPFTVLLANLGLDAVRPLAMRLGAYSIATMSIDQPVYFYGGITLLLFGGAIALIRVERRFWCRNICPLGALLSLLGRFSIWGRQVSDACISCTKCARECPMNAIGDDFKTTSMRECIQCQRCETVCPVDAISFGFAHPASEQVKRREFNPGRRGVLAAGVAGVATGLTAGTAASTATRDGNLIRPPGALVEGDFLDACLRCGECMKVCPTHALQPAFLQGGFEGLFTPRLVPRVGACEENCNLCGQVCPTGAVRKLILEEKKYAVVGNAMIDRTRCIAWEQLKVCLICDEVCPYDAVEFRMVTDEKGSLQRPFVLENKCVGCGQCEHGCPVNGPAAIHVTPVNEVRKNEGSYITEEMKKLREVDDSGVDFYREYDAGDDGSGGDAPSEPQAEPDFSGDEPPPGVFQF